MNSWSETKNDNGVHDRHYLNSGECTYNDLNNDYRFAPVPNHTDATGPQYDSWERSLENMKKYS